MYTVRSFAVRVGTVRSIVLSAVREEGGAPEVDEDAVDSNKPTCT